MTDQKNSQGPQAGNVLPERQETLHPGAPIQGKDSTAGIAQESVLTPTYTEDSQQQPEPIKSRKRLPKSIFLLVGFILVFVILIFLVIQLKPSALEFFGKQGEIVWWGVTKEEPAIRSLIAKYEEENPGINITYIKQSTQDYRERLTNALARGEGPDIFEYHNSWVPMFKSDLDTLPANVMSQQEFASIFYPVITSNLSTKEGIVGIPLGFDALTLYVNEDLFAAAGKTPPVTWDEFRKTALELTTKDERKVIIQSGAALGRTENVDHWPEIVAIMMFQNRVNPANPSGPLAEDALEFYSVFARDDGIWDETLPPSTVAFANGKVAMFIGPTWRANQINKLNSDLRFKTVPLPQLRKDDPSEPDISYATYWVEGVWNRSANSEVAWDFLKYLSQRDQLIELYNSTTKMQLLGDPYPRVDMSNLLNDHPITGSVIALAANVKSWYMASETYDGPTGINSQLTEIFKIAVDDIVNGTDPNKALLEVSSQVSRVLLQYGIRATP